MYGLQDRIDEWIDCSRDGGIYALMDGLVEGLMDGFIDRGNNFTLHLTQDLSDRCIHL